VPKDKRVRIEFGRGRLVGDDALGLDVGSIVVLANAVGDEVDVYVDGQLYARGEPVVVNGRLGVRVSEVLGCEMQEAT
jgi:flagellar motor switch protein FliN/FliY